jgi:hypothetical protein
LRVISNFHDYYDGVQKLGQDLSLIYNRVEIIEKFMNNTFPYLRGWNRFYNSKSIGFDSKIMGFCGKIYPLILIGEETISPYYTMDEIDLKVKSLVKERDYRDYIKGKYVSYLSLNRKSIIKFFNDVKRQQNNYLNLFLEHRSPIFITNLRIHFDSEIIYNCSLKKFKFYRVFDAYSAFQEISMFIGNLAVPLKPIPEIKNADLIIAKGFDKFSFRKDKQNDTR